MNHRVRLLGSVAVLSFAMAVTGCWVWDSLPCAAWCLLCCHWPDMISSIYPLDCLLREAVFPARLLCLRCTSKLTLWCTSKRRRSVYTVTRTILLQGQFSGNSLSQGQKCLQFGRQRDSKRYEFYVYLCICYSHALIYFINTVLYQF